MSLRPPAGPVAAPPTDRRWGLVVGVSCDMVSARILDLFSTRVLDSRLAGEQNLLHRAFGAGLATLVAVNFLLVMGLSALFARAVWLHPRMRPAQPGLGLHGFLSAFLFAGEYPWWHIAWRRPGRTRARWLVGRMVPWPTIGISLLAVSGNVLSHLGEPFSSGWTALVGSPARLLVTFAVYILALMFAWLLWEYALYRHGTRPTRGVSAS
jgi:hypothetical protein